MALQISGSADWKLKIAICEDICFSNVISSIAEMKYLMKHLTDLNLVLNALEAFQLLKYI